MGFESKLYKSFSGVTQSSNLGPALFTICILFINVVLSLFNSRVFVYADDLKLSAPTSSAAECVVLQEDLDRFVYLVNK